MLKLNSGKNLLCSARTVDVEPGDDLGDRVVEAKYDLDMSSRILGGDCDGIFGSDRRDFVKNAILDTPLDLFDFLESLFLIETIQKEVDVTCRCLRSGSQ